jgi:hypothetical protein
VPDPLTGEALNSGRFNRHIPLKQQTARVRR